jgi:hypothetical protein
LTPGGNCDCDCDVDCDCDGDGDGSVFFGDINAFVTDGYLTNVPDESSVKPRKKQNFTENEKNKLNFFTAPRSKILSHRQSILGSVFVVTAYR